MSKKSGPAQQGAQAGAGAKQPQRSGLFAPADDDGDLAYAKIALMGFAGSGKSFTAGWLSIGLHQHIAKATKDTRPVLFMDTEKGAGWVTPLFAQMGVPLEVARTRSFADLKRALPEAEAHASVLLIDSLSHYYVDLVEGFKRSVGRDRLHIGDWGKLKPQWFEFMENFVNANVHVIVCGRAAWDINEVFDDQGNQRLEKTDVKMKGEKEAGFEPHLVLRMERRKNEQGKTVHRMWCEKDRNPVGSIDGHMWEFTPAHGKGMAKKNVVFQAILPHVKRLCIGGTEAPVAAKQDSAHLFDHHGDDSKAQVKRDAAVELEKVQNAFTQNVSTRSQAGRKFMLDVLVHLLGTNSWKEVERIPVGKLQAARLRLEEMFTLVWAPLTQDERDIRQLDVQGLFDEAVVKAQAPPEGAGEGEQQEALPLDDGAPEDDLPF